MNGPRVHTHTHTRVCVGFPGSSGKECACQCRRHRRHGFGPWVRKIPWNRKCQPSTVFLPGKATGAWWATVHVAAKSWKQLRNWVNSTHRHTHTNTHTDTHTHTYTNSQPLKKKWISAIWSNMDGPKKYYA